MGRLGTLLRFQRANVRWTGTILRWRLIPNEVDEIAGRIRRLFVDTLSLNVRDEDLQSVARLDEMAGIDSIALLEFVNAVEKEFRVRIEPEQLELETLREPHKLAAYIASRLRKG